MKKEDVGKWISWFVLALVLIVVYKLLDNFGEIMSWFKELISVLMPFLMAILIAYLFYLPCRKVENSLRKSSKKFIRYKARWLSIFIVYLIAILVIVLILTFVIPNILTSLGELIATLPDYLESAKEALDNIPEDSIINKESIISIIDGLEEIDITNYINFESITEYAKGIIGVASGVFKVFVTVIVSIYILAERTQIVNFIKRLCNSLFNTKVYKVIGRYFRETNEIFFKFISGQIIDGVVVRNNYLNCNGITWS